MPTAVHLLRAHADNRPSDHAFRFMDEGMAAVSYQQLDTAARKIAVALLDAGAMGQPVLLLYPPGREYVAGFLGCLYAGALAVPAYPPDPTRLARTLPRLRALTTDCGARIALSVTGLADAAQSLFADAPELAGMRWLGTDTLPNTLAESWTQPRLDERTPALLQYTSGSTGTPKGVLLDHANLLHNSRLIHGGFDSTRDDIGMSWLPPYHDMGLIGGILQPIYAGFTTVLMSPLSFLHRPMAWLETISQLGVTISGGPNFAFELCVRKSTPQQRAELDLSQWSVAFCGAEPVRADTLDRFAEAFAPAGFRYQAFYPCYGMAEATLIVTGGRRHESPHVHRSDVAGARTPQITCGQALGEQRLVIADPETADECPTGTVGEIWLSGPSVARGYWDRPEETDETFRARLRSDPDRHYLRTGDLGFLDANRELVVTGRRKDLIIIRGRNLYPQDLEHTVETEVPWLRPGCTAAFPVAGESGERVGIASEIARRGDLPPVTEIIAAVHRAVTGAYEVSPSVVVLLMPGQVPKTSSGKIQRHACRQSHSAGDFSPGSPGVVACWDESDPGTGDGTATPASESVTPLAAAVARTLGVPTEAVRPDTPLIQLGLDSLRAMDLRHLLETELGIRVSLSDLLNGVDLNTLANHAWKAGADRTVEPDQPVPDRRTFPGTPAGPEYELPATEGQRALWFVQRWAPGTTAYQISRAVWVDSALDVNRLEQALHGLVERHPSLRICLPDRDGEPVQRIRRWSGPVLTRHDAAGLDDAALRELVRAEAARPFDLAHGPLFRAVLFTRDTDHVLLVALHHVITDFWSLSLMVRELMARYRSGSTSAGLPEPADPIAGPNPTVEASRLEFWRRALRGAPPALDLPTSYP
ncbi:MAG TPA: AMP-binding protein, partial [Micromonosporaceae bacterium]|nr:AMP-binding protein [Micromonosporaceae bacterium]